jgi:hypothetical protein
MLKNAALLNLCLSTDRLLWQSFAISCEGANRGRQTSGSKLIFPRKRDNKPRVSEQEARFLFCRAVEQSTESNVFYSVETPTHELYSFSTPGSDDTAHSDLSLYADGSLDLPAVNIEFKCGGVSDHRKDLSAVTKDFEKLLREKPDGLWFHLIQNTNRSTLPAVLGALKKALREAETKARRRGADVIVSKDIQIHVCCLSDRWSLSSAVHIDQANEPLVVDDFFSLASESAAVDVGSIGGAEMQPNCWYSCKGQEE